MSAKINTTPDYPEQLPSMVEAAEHDLPAVLQDMSNETRYGADAPDHGHRVVLADHLVEAIAEQKGHSRAAAAWAVYRLLERGLLFAQIASHFYADVVGQRQVPGRLMFGVRRIREEPIYDTSVVPLADPESGPVPYRHLLVYSTDQLWDWWRSASVGAPRASMFQAASIPRPIQSLSQTMPPTDPSDKLRAILQQATISRLAREEQERRDEEQRHGSERLIRVLDETRNATPDLLADRAKTQGEVMGDANAMFYPRWANRFQDLGQELNSVGLQYQLGELDDFVQREGNTDAGHYAVNLIRLACKKDQEQVEQFLRAAGGTPELQSVRIWLYTLAKKIVEMRNRIWVENLTDAAERQMQEQDQGGRPEPAINPVQRGRAALERCGDLLPHGKGADESGESAYDSGVEQLVRLGEVICDFGLDASLTRLRSSNEIAQRAIELLRFACQRNRHELGQHLRDSLQQGQVYVDWLRYWLRKVVKDYLDEGEVARHSEEAGVLATLREKDRVIHLWEPEIDQPAGSGSSVRGGIGRSDKERTTVFPAVELQKLLREALSAEELEHLCFYDARFRDVFHDFASGQNNSQRIQALVSYVERRSLQGALVDAVEVINPVRAKEFRARFAAANPEPANSSNYTPASGGGPVVKTVLELDMVGYSSIARLLEQNMGAEAVAGLNAQIQGLVDVGLKAVGLQRDTTVLATTGDGAILVFDRADEAHRFAAVLHAAAKARSAAVSEASAKRRFRTGAATGEIVLRPRAGGGYDMAGVTIANAVRLEAAGRPGELLLDATTYDALPAELRVGYQAEEQVRGKREETFRARRCVMDAEAAEAAPAPAHAAPAPPAGNRRTIVSLFGKLYPQTKLDTLLFLLEMPLGAQPARTLTYDEQCNAVLRWAECPAGPGLSRLEEELRELGEREAK